MNKVQIQIIKEAMDQCDKLTDWEVAFIDSIADYDERYEFTEKQNEVLNRIGNKME